MLAGITAGWPKVLSGLKTLLETGESPAADAVKRRRQGTTSPAHEAAMDAG
jgi:hypothetical protein